MTAIGRQGLDIGLNAGATGWVQAGQTEHVGPGVRGIGPVQGSVAQNGFTTTRMTMAINANTGASLK